MIDGNQQTDSEILSQIIAIIELEFQIHASQIKLDSRIREDLGICGDDGIDLFKALAENFKVDLSEFEHSDFFELEALSIKAFFTKKWWTTFQHLKTITVEQLVEAVKAGSK